MGAYLVAFVVILGVNLLPAFGPPTWALLVFFKLNSDLAAVPLVIGGAVAAATGRLLLAVGSRRLRGRFSPARLEHLAAAERALTGDPRRDAAQLFVAAGLLNVRLVPLTLVFFAGRLVSYSIYVGGASLASDNLSDTLRGAFTSPLGVALQVLMLGGLVALVRVDWARVLARHS
jgi:hypothetical protein